MNKLPTIPKLPGAAGELETFAMANCLMILSNHRNASVVCGGGEEEETGRSYPCKTCGRKFPSFQALGGHRASHKKIKSDGVNEVSNIPAKPKVHACAICGVEFPIGQALGGHMRRHRGLLVGSGGGAMVVSTEGSVGNSDDNNNNDDDEKKRKMIDDHDDDDVGGGGVPVLRKSSSSKRVCLDLTLRLWRKQDEEQVVVVKQGSHVNHDDFLKLELRCH